MPNAPFLLRNWPVAHDLRVYAAIEQTAKKGSFDHQA
jgi:hypothetical protein